MVGRYCEQHPSLEGHISLPRDLGLSRRGFHYVPYREYIDISGIAFTHVPMNAANKPIDGMYGIHRAVDSTATSMIYAHTHRFDTMNYYRHGNDDIIQVMTCGCFFEEADEYAEGGQNHYWKGIVLVYPIGKGRFDFEQISIERLYSRYSS